MLKTLPAVIFLFAGACAPAFAQTPSPSPAAGVPAGPIAVTTCELMKQNSQLGMGNLFINGKAYNFFKVGFVNNGDAVADRIVFQIDFEKSRYVIGDTGTYAQGVSITHIYRDHGKGRNGLSTTGGCNRNGLHGPLGAFQGRHCLGGADSRADALTS